MQPERDQSPSQPADPVQPSYPPQQPSSPNAPSPTEQTAPPQVSYQAPSQSTEQAAGPVVTPQSSTTLTPEAVTPVSAVETPQAANSPVVTLTPDQPPVATPTASVAPEEPLHWQGTEYVHHEKDAVWFVIFGVVVVILMAAAIFLVQSWTFGVLIPVMAIALIVYTRRPPRLIDYTLSPKGLYVNDHLYAFSEFKGFGVIRDGNEYSIMLIPTKRFRLGVSIYFPEDKGEVIVDMLGARLPMQEMKLDAFDRIIHKLRI